MFNPFWVEFCVQRQWSSFPNAIPFGTVRVQRLRLHTPNAGSTGSVPGQETKSMHAAWHDLNIFLKDCPSYLWIRKLALIRHLNVLMTWFWTFQPPKLWEINVCSAPSLSHVWLFATPWTSAHQASLSITNSQSPPKPMSIESVMPSNHLILCCPLLLLLSIFPSIRVFLNESALCIRWPKYWSYSFSISPSNEHPGLISFRMDWLDLLAVQGTLKSLLQHHSSKASVQKLIRITATKLILHTIQFL